MMIYPNLHIQWAAAHLGEDTLCRFMLELVVQAFNDLLWLQYPKLIDVKSLAWDITCLSHSTLPPISVMKGRVVESFLISCWPFIHDTSKISHSTTTFGKGINVSILIQSFPLHIWIPLYLILYLLTTPLSIKLFILDWTKILEYWNLMRVRDSIPHL